MMLQINSSRKGVSPLIATVLLIAFAVALGSVVMNWGIHLNLGKNDDCKNVEVMLKGIGKLDACYGGLGENGYINFVLQNQGSSNINGVSLWVSGTSGAGVIDVDGIAIKKGEYLDKTDKSVIYNFVKYGDVKEIQFVPIVKDEAAKAICLKNAIKAESIGQCN